MSKLQLMHLKVAMQNIGLDSETLGWLILEKLVLDCDYSDKQYFSVSQEFQSELIRTDQNNSYFKNLYY